jgi:hypothetical protein
VTPSSLKCGGAPTLIRRSEAPVAGILNSNSSMVMTFAAP